MKSISDIITDIIDEQAPSDEVAVLMSGGVDSLTCAFSAMRLGKTVNSYTIMVDGNESPDSIASDIAAKEFGWNHKLINVPIDNLKEDFITLIKKYNCKSKTQLECSYPFLYLFPHVKEKHVLTGICADSLYGMSKQACIHYKHTKEKFDEYRHMYHNKENPAGVNQLVQFSEEIGANLVSPYYTDDVFNWALQYEWEYFHKPFQKAPIINSYPEFDRLPKKRRHSPLQLTAGIPAVMESLLNDSDINFKNRGRIMDVVRDWSTAGTATLDI